MFLHQQRRVMHLLVLAITITVAAEAPSETASWPNWRGPECSGYTDCSLPLVDDIMQARLAWRSEQLIPSGLGKDNYGSGFNDVIVAENTAFYHWWSPSGPADEHVYRALTWTRDLRKKMGRQFSSYIKNAAVHVEERSRPQADDTIVAWDLRNGESLWTASMAGKGFNTGYQTITYGIFSPHLVSCYDQGTLVCFSSSGRVFALRATDGKPKWEGRIGPMADHLSMRLADFKRRGSYFAGSGTRFFTPSQKNGTPDLGMRSSGIIADGVIAIADNRSVSKSCGMVGIDLHTGKLLWQIDDCLNVQASMPLRWRHQGKEYLIAVGLDRGFCVDPRSGRILWEITGNPLCAETQAALQGDYLITPGKGSYGRGKGEGRLMTCWKLALDQAVPVWEAKDSTRMRTFSGPVIRGDKIYFKGGGAVTCRNLQTGTLLGNAKGNSSNAALVMMGDRLFIGNAMFSAASDGSITAAGTLAQASREHDLGFDTTLSDWTSATVCDGHLLYRNDTSVLCWDLSDTPRKKLPRVSLPSIKDAAAAITALQHRAEKVRKAGKTWLLANKAAALPVINQLAAIAGIASTDSWQAASAAAEVLISLGAETKAMLPTLKTSVQQALSKGDAAMASLLTKVVLAADINQAQELATAAAAQINDPDLLKVQAACQILHQCGATASLVRPQLITLIGDGDDRALEFAIALFSQIDASDQECASALIQAINTDPSSDRACIAARCLDALPPGAVEASDALMTAFCRTAGPTRFWLSEVLTEIGPAMIDKLLKEAAQEFEAGKSSDSKLLLDVGKTCMNLGTKAKAALPWLEAKMKHLAKKDATLATEQDYMKYCCDVIAGRPVTLVARNGKHREGIPLGNADQCEAYFRAKAAGAFKGKYSPKNFSPENTDEK